MDRDEGPWMGAIGQGRYDQDDTFCIELIGLARGDFVLGGFCPGAFCLGGFCPAGFCPGGFCHVTLMVIVYYIIN